MNNKILIIGDNIQSKWHPLKGFDAVISSILSDSDITITDDYSQLEIININKYDVCIVLLDRWVPLENSKLEGVRLFVELGKGLLILHQGISMQVNPELSSLIGGRFNGHPEQALLRYETVENSMKIGEGIDFFEALEEPYLCTINQESHPEIILKYQLDQQTIPAGWAISYGRGKVIYLSPGHRIETFYQEKYRLLIKQCVNWLTK
jgi:type 1 glutamine amidotransferase